MSQVFNPHRHLKTAEFVANLLDSQFKVAGLSVGLDSILGFIPGFGDIAGALFSLYLVWVAKSMKIPQFEINKMMMNIIFDVALGMIPLVGDIGDIFFKANKRNLDILRKYAPQAVEEGVIDNTSNTFNT